jgi:tetratricopeptide (TPR) repeat protein
MKKHVKQIAFLIVCTFFTITSKGQCNIWSDRFQEGVALSEEKKIDDALEVFQNLEKSNIISPELYFNIGNCYFLKEAWGPAIINFERAKLFDYRNPNISAHLNAAYKEAGLFSTLPSSFEILVDSFSLKEWTMFASLSFHLFVLSIFLLGLVLNFEDDILWVKKVPKNVLYCISLISSSLLIVCIIGIWSTYPILVHSGIIQRNTSVQISPFENAENIASLKSGEKVFKTKKYKDYYYIRTESGVKGWLKKTEVEWIIPNML